MNIEVPSVIDHYEIQRQICSVLVVYWLSS